VLELLRPAPLQADGLEAGRPLGSGSNRQFDLAM
jgi:hypothetical protein